MTEQEAINILKSDSCYECTYGQNSPVDCVYGACRVSKAVKIAINSLEEIQQYRAIGTPNQIYIRMGGYIEELSKYAAIGTPEECRAAVEKQTAKKPEKTESAGYRYTDTYRCPTCGGNFSGTGIAEYCYHCGQKLDWSDGE